MATVSLLLLTWEVTALYYPKELVTLWVYTLNKIMKYLCFKGLMVQHVLTKAMLRTSP